MCRSSIRASLLLATVGAIGAASQASAVAASPAPLIETIPPDASQVRYDAKDQFDKPLTGLDVIADPDGSGYLGVYFSSTCKSPVAAGKECPTADQENVVKAGESDDLLNWRSIAELDTTGGNMPTIRDVGGGRLLVAYEDYGRSGDRPEQSRVVVRYYPSRARLVTNQPARQVALPRRLSRYNEGTPTIESVSGAGAAFNPARAQIRIGFHYNSTTPRVPAKNGRPARPAKPGPDRQAVGVLRGFSAAGKRWAPTKRASVDRRIDAAGFPGKHGKRTRFSYDGQTWNVYEAKRAGGELHDFDRWNLVLAPPSGPAQGLTVAAPDGPFTSIGVPTMKVLPAPGGAGSVFFTSSTVFTKGGPRPGALLYYHALVPAR